MLVSNIEMAANTQKETVRVKCMLLLKRERNAI